MKNSIFNLFFLIFAAKAYRNINFKNRSLVLAMVVFAIAFSVLLSTNKALADVGITAPSLTVYSCGTYPTSYYTLGNVVIAETSGNKSDFGNGSPVTFDLSIPAPYQFNTAVGTASSTGGNIGTTASLSFPNTTTIRITYTGSGMGSNTLDQITISGLQILATASSSSVAYLTWLVSTPTNPILVGGSGPAYATLSSAVFPSAFAGNDQLICGASATLGATAAVSGTGTWTWVGSPTGTITSPTSATSTITGLTDGTYQLKWTTSNGSCGSNSTVYITVQTTAGSMACLTPVNYFANVTNISTPQTLTCPVAATSPTIFTLGGPDVSKFSVGDKVLVIQMQGAIVSLADSSVLIGGKDAVFGKLDAAGTDAGYNGAGNYEYAIIATKSGNDVTFAGNLKNYYGVGAGKNVQLVTVPVIANYTVSASTPLIGKHWDKTTGLGGVLIFEVVGTLTIDGTISMDYKGFLGGGNVLQTSTSSTAVVKPTVPATGTNYILNFGVYNGQCGMGPYSTGCANGPCNGTFPIIAVGGPLSIGWRGDGIATDSKYPYGHGALANAGGSGGGWNSGGGGGANVKNASSVYGGGRGGNEFLTCFNLSATDTLYKSNLNAANPTGLPARIWGVGGYGLDAATATRVFMGGGGGAGNGDEGIATPGGNGGGIIIITASTIAGTTGTITAKGQPGYSNATSVTQEDQFSTNQQDASGGGGAGGSVVLNVGTYSIGTLNVIVDGGKGGDSPQSNTCFGSGGGGGSGLVRYNAITSNVQISSLVGIAGRQDPGSSGTCATLTPWKAQAGVSGSLSKTSVVLPIPQKSCCSDADLGADQSICGQASIILTNGTASNTNKTFTWYKNGVILAGSPCTTCPTYTATTAGVYSVKVDSIVGGINYCSSTASMVITNSFPTPYLGPNQVLCSPSYVDLAPINVTFPSGTTFSWTKDGTATGITTSNLDNATSGTYIITATAGAGCGPTSSTITLSSGLPTVTGACRASTGTLTLTATGGNGGPYKWYTAQTSGTLEYTGTSFVTPSLSTTTTYWVEDIATTNSIWGASESQTSGTPTNGGGASAGIYAETFEVIQACTLSAVTINMASAGTSSATITVNIRSGSSNTVTPVLATVSKTGTAFAAGDFIRIVFTTPVALAVGSYTIDPVGTTVAPGGRTLGTQLTGVSYPYYGTDIALGNMVKFTGTLDPTVGNRTLKWGSFYDFEFSYTKQCDRVPVVAEIGGSCASPTPVTLSSFTAEKADNDVVLDWTTNSEFNNDYFLVQRSTDGINFATIGRIEGNGTTYILHNYRYIDTNVPYSLLYYRLLQVDLDGQSSSTKIVLVKNQKEASINVYPNPFENGTNVAIRSRFDYKVNIRIMDIRGEVLYNSSSGSNDNIVVGQDISFGVYVLEVRTDYEVKTFRIVKVDDGSH